MPVPSPTPSPLLVDPGDVIIPTASLYLYKATKNLCSRGTCIQSQGLTVVGSTLPLTIGYYYTSSNSIGAAYQVTALNPSYTTPSVIVNRDYFTTCKAACSAYIPTFSPLPSITPSITKTPSVTPTVTKTPSVTPSVTATPSPTPFLSPTPTPSVTATISVTPSISKTPSITPTPSVSFGVSATFKFQISQSANPLFLPTASIIYGTDANGLVSHYRGGVLLWNNSRLESIYPSSRALANNVSASSGVVNLPFGSGSGVTASFFYVQNSSQTPPVGYNLLNKIYKNDILIASGVGQAWNPNNYPLNQVVPSNPIYIQNLNNNDVFLSTYEFVPTTTVWILAKSQTTATPQIRFNFIESYNINNPNSWSYTKCINSSTSYNTNACPSIGFGFPSGQNLSITLKNTNGQDILFGVGENSGNFTAYSANNPYIVSLTGSNVYIYFNIAISNGQPIPS